MKYLVAMLCCLALTLLTIATAAANQTPARLSMLNGQIMLKPADSAEWSPAAINTPLQEGDSIWCPEQTRAEIQLPDGGKVRLDSATRLIILSLDSSFLQLHASQGRLFVNTGDIKEQRLQIDADNTTVIPFGRTRLRIDLRENGEEDVSIFQGSAYVEGNGNRTRVRAGEQLVLEEGGRNELLPLNPPDDWERWNASLDKTVRTAGQSVRYLPEEIRPYSSEFDANGQWVNVPEYGYVWRPTVVVAADWAPYRYGSWAWVGGDYVWLSTEPWGWAPYHYGRWVTTPSFGWCWVPPLRGDVFWGPGFVAWFTIGATIGWLPLAPGEIYYGHGHYGRHSVNVTNVTVRETVVIDRYRNYSHRNAVTVVERDNFVRGRTVVTTSGREIRNVAALPGRPQMQPVRESRTPGGRDEHGGKQAVVPAARNERSLTQYREQFPRVNAPPPRRSSRVTAPVKPGSGRGQTGTANVKPDQRTQATTPVRPTKAAPPAAVLTTPSANTGAPAPQRTPAATSAPAAAVTPVPQRTPAAAATPAPSGITPVQRAPGAGRQGDAAGMQRSEPRKTWKVYGTSGKTESRPAAVRPKETGRSEQKSGRGGRQDR